MSRISVKKKPSQANASGMVVGGGTKKITKTNSSLKSLNMNSKWSTLAAFALVFGGIGSWLLFSSHADTAAQNGNIFLGNYSVNPTGTDYLSNNLPSEAQQSTQSESISRDGQHMAYFDKTKGQIVSYATATPTTQASFLLPGTSPYVQQTRWSPDDTWIAVSYNDTQGNHVYVSHPDGSGGTTVQSDDPNLSEVEWLADSSTLAYFTSPSDASGLDICTIQVDSTKKVCNNFSLPSGGAYSYVQSFTVSPNGASVAFAGAVSVPSADGSSFDSQVALYMVNIDGTGVHQIKPASSDSNVSYHLAWSPDSAKIAYQSNSSSSALHTMNVDGSNDTDIFGQGVQGSNTYVLSNVLLWPAQVPGQTSTPLPAAGVAVPHRNGGLWTVLPLSTQGGTDLYGSNSSYAVSPVDGKQVVYIGTNSGYTEYSLNSMLVNGTGIKTGLVTLPGSSWKIAGWSPDGQWIALTKNAGVYETWIVHPDGTGLRRVFGSPYDITHSLSWAADSGHLLYATADGANVNLCSADLANAAASCKVVLPYSLPVSGSFSAAAPILTVSPDGKIVLFGLNNISTISGTATVNGYALYKANADGSSVTKLQQQSGVQLYNLAYAPDGTKIALETQTISTSANTYVKSVVYSANTDGTGQVATSAYTNTGSYKPVWQPLPLTIKKVAGDYTGAGLATGAGTFNGNTSWYVDGYNYNIAFGNTNPMYRVNDIPVPADYNGDGTTDIAVWRPTNATWYVRNGVTTAYGQSGDIPVPGNYLSATGAANLAVYRPTNGTWYVRGGATTQFGANGDVPAPADYNGDGKIDLAVYRPSNHTFYMLLAGKTTTKALGTTGDAPMPGDYDGSGHAEAAVYRSSNSTFYYVNKAGVTTAVQVGKKGDTPAPADYDGNGTIDPAVLAGSGLVIAGQATPAVVGAFNEWLYPYPVYNLALPYISAGSANSVLTVNSAANQTLVAMPAHYGVYGTAIGVTPVITSTNGEYQLVNSSGQLYLYSNKDQKTHYFVQGVISGHKYATILTKDGNLEVLDTSNKNKVMWQTNTVGKGAKNLTLTTTGDLVLYGASNKVVWHSGTAATLKY